MKKYVSAVIFLFVIVVFAARIDWRAHYERYVPMVKSIHFALDAELQDCLVPVNAVFSRYLTVEENAFEKHKASVVNILRKWFGEPSDIYVDMAYSLQPDPGRSGLVAQDISVTFPQIFHDEALYEISCKNLTDGEYFVFRKYSRKMSDHNYSEPPTTLLPKNCIGESGNISIRMKNDVEHNQLASLLPRTALRAVYWNPSSTFINPRDVDFYLQKRSFSPGEEVEVYAHALDDSVTGTVDIFRAGNPVPVLRFDGIQLAQQKIDAYSYRDGLSWTVTTSFKIPRYLESGYYIAVLTQKTERSTYGFVVKPAAGSRPQVVLIAATNTWNAYNSWGGTSFYKNDIGVSCLNTDYARLISSIRPDTNKIFPVQIAKRGAHLFDAERFIGEWLTKNSIDHGIYSEDELDLDASLLDHVPLVMLPSHPEYYTEAMHDKITQHTERGGNIISLGGNVMYYRVARSGDKMEKHENGRLYDLDQKFGGFWSRHLQKSASRIFGSEYDARDWNTFAPYKVVDASHPVFANTGLQNGDLFGEDSSGLEMDVLQPDIGLNATLLASGTNPAGYGGSMVMVENQNGGKVFSVGSISFAFGLMRDERLGVILKNVLQLMHKPE